MKIILTFFALLFAASTYSQDTSRAGSLYLGLNTNFINEAPLSETVDPYVTYFISDTWAIGGKFDFSQEESTKTRFLLNVQKYITDNAFLGAVVSSNFDGTNSFGANIGYTAFLGSRFYLEPSWLWRVEDSNHYGNFQVSCGFKLKD